MANNQSTVKFDHREIAVIFSLFVFVALLMFTVGILVGKGLATAKYEGKSSSHKVASHDAQEEEHPAAAEHGNTHESAAHASLGTSITTGHDEHKADSAHEARHPSSDEHATDTHAANDHSGPPSSAVEEDTAHGSAHVAAHDTHNEEAAHEPLELEPAKPKHKSTVSKDDFHKTKESEAVLKNPKLAKLFEGGGSASHSAARATASVPTSIPKSAAQGTYTVQVGSYPNQREAQERVEALKKIGFPYAYLSPIAIPGKSETYYRVWLGFFPNADTARTSGEILQSRGEVQSYIVRKANQPG